MEIGIILFFIIVWTIYFVWFYYKNIQPIDAKMCEMKKQIKDIEIEVNNFSRKIK